VILNLITNAAQALEIADGRKRIEISSSAGERRVTTVVADSGPGVAPEHCDSIFDPFFTTKRGGGAGPGAPGHRTSRHQWRRCHSKDQAPVPGDSHHHEVQLLQERHLKENSPFVIAESNAIQEVMALVDMVARSRDASVLIPGETGTGKELIASTIHHKSPDFSSPFVTLNCSTIPDGLIESELFGCEKGAFSGAAPAGKTGLVESAGRGGRTPSTLAIQTPTVP
jgi:hypothetical protein